MTKKEKNAFIIGNNIGFFIPIIVMLFATMFPDHSDTANGYWGTHSGIFLPFLWPGLTAYNLIHSLSDHFKIDPKYLIIPSYIGLYLGMALFYGLIFLLATKLFNKIKKSL